MSTVTVMIPSYNYARFLPEAVMSAVEQQGVELDVVIVDNASTDDSLQIARDLEAKYDCVRVVSYPDNHGIVCSFNRCLEEARGEFSVMLCADDCLTPGSLQRSTELLRKHPSVGLVYGPVLVLASSGPVEPAGLSGRSQDPIFYAGADWIERRCRVGRNPIRAPEALVRTAVRQAAGVFDPACPHTFDLNMWMRIAVRSGVAYLPGVAQAMYRVHGDNFSTDGYGNSLPDLVQHWTAFDNFVAEVPGSHDGERWRRLAQVTMARRARWAAARVLASPSPTRLDECDQLLALSVTIAGAPIPWYEQINFAVQRRLGPRAMAAYPPFAGRLLLRAARRMYTEWRKVRRGV